MATEVDPEEDIARAICSDHYDGERYSSSLFKGQNTSVSSLAIVPLEDSWDLFRRKVEKPPDRTFEQIGTINVGSLKEIGINHLTNTELSVQPDPQPNYDSHAIIPQKISKGLANKIIDELVKHDPMS